MMGLGRISVRIPTGKASIGGETQVWMSYQSVSIECTIEGGSYGGTGYFSLWKWRRKKGVIRNRFSPGAPL
jgi:hypothetical protein